MPNTTITVGGVTLKEGTSKAGKPYKKFDVHSESGEKFSTFSASDAEKARGLVGKLATVNYTTTDYGNDLGFIDPAPAGAVAAEAIKSRDPETGGADWDLIGLRKTRCLLWAHYLGSDMATKIVEATTEGSKADAVYRIGTRLIELAESDIFHRDPAEKDASVPF